jgi:hypothetical protein
MDLPLDEPYTCLYNEVFDLDGTGLTKFGIDMGRCPNGIPHIFKQRYELPDPGEKHGHAWYECTGCGERIPLW